MAGVIAHRVDTLVFGELPSVADVAQARENIIQQACESPLDDPILTGACNTIELGSPDSILAAKIRANEIADKNGRNTTIWGIAAGAILACVGVSLELRGIKNEYPN